MEPSWRHLVYLAVALLVLGWLLKTPEGLLGKADAIGYAVCHRIEVRSFHLGDRQLPLCARCSGMYLGAMLGITFQAIRRSRRGGMPGWKLIAVLGGMVAAFGIDGVNSYLHLFPGLPGLYQPTNTLRLLTGTGMGLAVSSVVYPAFNQTTWQDWSPQPALESLQSLGLLVLLALGLDLLVLSGNPLVLYPLALISAAGVLALLTAVYSMAWMMLFHAENSYRWFRQLTLPLVSGFGLAMVQIIGLDLVRFALTGTWEGFHLG